MYFTSKVHCCQCQLLYRSSGRFFSSAKSFFPGSVKLQFDDYNDSTNTILTPLIIKHGMLGSRHNWTSIAKQLHKTTG